MQAEIGMRLGFREMDTLGTLLKAMAKSPPLDFTYTGQIFFGFNPETDMVYLYNEDYETVILEAGKAVRTYWFESVQYEHTAESAFEDIFGKENVTHALNILDGKAYFIDVSLHPHYVNMLDLYDRLEVKKSALVA